MYQSTCPLQINESFGKGPLGHDQIPREQFLCIVEYQFSMSYAYEQRSFDFKRYKKNKQFERTYLDSFVLLGKHSSKEGSGRKSGAAGSIVCFGLTLVVLVTELSNDKVALGLTLKL